ncbi:MAG: hypothetical protein Q9228_007326 [Teloschistes exilis]
MMLPRELIHNNISLIAKPTAKIHYTFAAGKDLQHHTSTLVVFLNGLMSDKTSWLPVMSGVIRGRPESFPSLLAYDRYGQGLTGDRDPQDQGREGGYGHDVADVVKDLNQLIMQIAHDKMDKNPAQLQLIFVANSIGCAIARLYAQSYPGSVTALLLLDPMMASSNFDWWPDPDSEGFDPKELPSDVTVQVLREQRAKFAAMFAPSVVNKEGLDRRNLADLLPYSDRPPLVGKGDRQPLLVIVEHDPERFAHESLQVGSMSDLRSTRQS